MQYLKKSTAMKGDGPFDFQIQGSETYQCLEEHPGANFSTFSI